MTVDCRCRAGRTGAAVLAASLMALALAGCSDSEAGKPATQVAVRVDGEEISVHQVNFLLAQAGAMPPERVTEARPRAVDRLVEQSLLVRRARDAKLERNPDVLQALEAARREILARAYLEQVVGVASKPAAEEVTAYYGAHPELFAERKIYRLREIVVSGDAATLERARGLLSRSDSMEAATAQLKAQQIPFRADAGVKAAEQLPLEQLPRFHQLAVGQRLVVDTGSALAVVEVAGLQSQPVDAQAAAPLIEQFLLKERRSKLAEAEMARLRAAAQIEYLGDFAAPAAKPVAVAAAPGAGSGLQTMDKGLKGLK